MITQEIVDDLNRAAFLAVYREDVTWEVLIDGDDAFDFVNLDVRAHRNDTFPPGTETPDSVAFMLLFAACVAEDEVFSGSR